MEKKVINGWHRSCAEDLPEIGEIVLVILQDIDEDGNLKSTEEPSILFNWRTEDEGYAVDELGWCKVYADTRVSYWYRLPEFPEEFRKSFICK